MSDQPCALVTGANGGIGAATLAELTRRGWCVVGVQRSDGFDVTKPGESNRAVGRALAEFGRLDAVVHTVGMSGRRFGDGPISAVTDEGWAEVLRVNAYSTMSVLRAALPQLPRGGSAVVVGSVLRTATDQDFLTAAYAASKGAIHSLVRVAAREYAPHGVRVNVVAPGLVDTKMAQRALGEGSAIRDRLDELQPLGGTSVSAEEVAKTVAWLVIDATATTGAEIVCDRGWTL